MHECDSTLVTSNLPFQEWTEILGSERLTAAPLPRIFNNLTASYWPTFTPPHW
jgi:DNA replication protein DnaC